MFPSVLAIYTILNHKRYGDLYAYAVNSPNTDKTALNTATSAALTLTREIYDKELRHKLECALLDVSSRATEFGFDAGAQLQHVLTKTEYPRIEHAWEQAKADSEEAKSTEKKN